MSPGRFIADYLAPGVLAAGMLIALAAFAALVSLLYRPEVVYRSIARRL